VVDKQTLAITDGCHPLLPDGVTNSVRLARQSALVTGSNMAGKTTFIKMLACNAILGQTTGFCLASAATIPRATVMASIHGLHSVASGKSHYFTEIKTIDAFIRGGAPGRDRILVIDEPFSGTNTVERIAVARAVLEALETQAIVLVTTHDVELQAMLGDRYVLYHFQENPDAEGYFDYRLRPGPATERNAIRLLGRLGFPQDITANALAYAEAVGERDGTDTPSALTTGNA
jgi:DNA mismatch repair ATPase MutS